MLCYIYIYIYACFYLNLFCSNPEVAPKRLKSSAAAEKAAQKAAQREAEKVSRNIAKLVPKALAVIRPMESRISKLVDTLGQAKLEQLPQCTSNLIVEKRDLLKKWLKGCCDVTATFQSKDQLATWDMVPFTDLKEVSTEMKACGDAAKAVAEAKKALSPAKKKKKS